ncbi:hypothetical protein [Demequina sp. SO4-18]|uniref:hypothetical protein n=1 Tax=Demequina sp. SO4-18 TaxID=3401026 RepID=UPI003B5AF042
MSKSPIERAAEAIERITEVDNYGNVATVALGTPQDARPALARAVFESIDEATFARVIDDQDEWHPETLAALLKAALLTGGES